MSKPRNVKSAAAVAGAAPCSAKWRAPDDLPDDECTVLVRLANDEWPITLGFHEDGEWRDNLADEIATDIVLGWMHLEDAARLLDQQSPMNGLGAAGAQLQGRGRDTTSQQTLSPNSGINRNPQAKGSLAEAP